MRSVYWNAIDRSARSLASALWRAGGQEICFFSVLASPASRACIPLDPARSRLQPCKAAKIRSAIYIYDVLVHTVLTRN